jgi:hypothetical protein
MKKTPFTLTPYEMQWVIVLAFASAGFALYVRYFAIENPPFALACDAGMNTWLCNTRSVATALFRKEVFGITALIIAALNLLRPSIVLLSAGIVAAAFGLALYNPSLAGFAVGLLILGFARPAPAT